MSTAPSRALSSWTSAFNKNIRSRAETYANLRRVALRETRPGYVRARVQGSLLYEVLLTWDPADPDRWEGQCDCRAFRRYGPCKHIWGVVLVACAEGVAPVTDEAREAEERVAEPLKRITEGAHRPGWRQRLDATRRATSDRAPRNDSPGPRRQRIEYAVLLHESAQVGRVVIGCYHCKRSRTGEWGPRSSWTPGPDDPFLSDLDRRVLARLLGGDELEFGFVFTRSRASQMALDPATAGEVLPLAARTGNLYWIDEDESGPLDWDDGPPWELCVEGYEIEDGLCVTGSLMRAGKEEGLDAPDVLLEGFLVQAGAIARFDARGAQGLARDMHLNGPIVVPRDQVDEMVAALVPVAGRALGSLTGFTWATHELPEKRLFVEEDGRKLACRIIFAYGPHEVALRNPAQAVLHAETRALVRRDFEREREALAELGAAGAELASTRPDPSSSGVDATLEPRRLPRLVGQLLARDWVVRAQGKVWRAASGVSTRVHSGQDWFDLEGAVSFGEQTVPLPTILAAARSGQRMVELGDGSVGMLPERWLEEWGWLELGEDLAGGVRFKGNQGWLLDSLLAARGEVTCDEAFATYRERLGALSELRPLPQPETFEGELRPYQRDALGWFAFLREFGLGGCLADDMGLGKTVQVLALLEGRRLERAASPSAGGPGPSLVVAPRSLVFNWIDEAARFAPRLEVLDFTGTERNARREEISRVDLVITTYGTLRRDVAFLSDQHFAYVVLDEAQAIKNHTSQAAKAARLLRGDHRLTLSGTPIENELGELWSLFEFLNPGMLGRSTHFQRLLKAGAGYKGLVALGKALRPFFMRRTKGEVLDDLPPKTEQPLVVELTGRDRKRYDELRDYYRAELLNKEREQGLGRMKLQVLESLLRLRQAACHPGLIDASLRDQPSAKLDALLPRLQELAAEGSKALVFSQFTSFLAILRSRLDAIGLRYEYLDGKTRNRKVIVDRFQSDESIPLFLISLKAGGSGLNLTAADYVFLLDPWWNPAVEAQAVDRAHRIGRTKPVFAYRVVAKDTVEDKVLALQAEKRELAETLLGEAKGPLKGLTRRDLETLFS